jgi:hypothetical protein
MSCCLLSQASDNEPRRHYRTSRRALAALFIALAVGAPSAGCTNEGREAGRTDSDGLRFWLVSFQPPQCARPGGPADTRMLQADGILSDRLVLQAERPVLWGTASMSMGRTAVEIDGRDAEVAQFGEEVVAESGTVIFSWKVELYPQPAGGPREIRVVSERLGSVELHDVLFGDVFICGGQSNMQMGMADAHWEDMASINAMAQDGSLENIRILTVMTDPDAEPHSPPAWSTMRHNRSKFNSLSTVHTWMPVNPKSIYGPSCFGDWSKW